MDQNPLLDLGWEAMGQTGREAELRSYEPSVWDRIRWALNAAGQSVGYDDLWQRTADTANLVGTAAMMAPGLAIGPATGAARDAAMAQKLEELFPFAESIMHKAHGGGRIVQREAPDAATIFQRADGPGRYTPVGYHSMQWANNAKGGKLRTSEDFAQRLVGANDRNVGIIRR